jgi:hypothetical protein
MDHAEAVNKGAVERYQLGELSEKEIDEFETHFFECTDCTDELRAGAIFEENAKAVFLEDSRSAAGAREPRVKYEARGQWWASFWKNPWSAVPALVAVALLCMVVYQAKMMRQALAPQAMASFVLPAISRGDDRVVEVAKNDMFYALYMDPAWPGSYSEYLCAVQDEKGSTLRSVLVSAPLAGKPIQILMSRNQLPSGHYTVIVRHPAANGQPESELGRYSFILKLD